MEVVFSWPGIGAYAAQAAVRRDMPVLQAVVLLSVITFRLGTDAMRAVGWLIDPRRRSRAA
jgi:ABC-type dipeptide/oligopeptide/nickel transport system permease component